MNNHFKTYCLLAGLTALFGGVGFIIGGRGGMMLALLIACGTNLFAFWHSDKAVLKMVGAKPVGASSAPAFYRMTQNLVQKASMPMPKLYIMQTDQPNAFATGRNPDNAAVAITTGLMNLLSSEELEGVIAHELAHIKNRDTLIMTVTATLAGAIGMIANLAMFMPFFRGSDERDTHPIAMIALSILAPIAAMIVQMTISRMREYQADKIGASLCENPLALASALQKIETHVRGGHVSHKSVEEAPATAHLFIINPLLGKTMDNLFSTHPNTQNRIEALEKMAPAFTKNNRQKQQDTQRISNFYTVD